MTLLSDTIAAVASPFGQGAVSLVRLSGPGSREIFARCWRGRELVTPRLATFGRVVRHGEDGREAVVDDGLATFFQGPASFTGEDVVEFTGHGGILVTRRVLETVMAAGARLAEPGEFTQRAFLNGKLDLTQAEAVMDLISAQTDLALRAAREQLAGRLGASMESLRADLLGLLAHVEAFLDFPEDDIDPDTGAALIARIGSAHQAVERLLATADQGRILREGVRTVIVGAPNVGKSSLLNRLLGFDRAIVSDIPGTTRDTLEEVINVRGLPLRLIDTAGLREAADALERAGIERSEAALRQAELVIEVADGSRPRESRISPDAAASAARILVLNKADLGEHPSWQEMPAVRVSCTAGTGLDDLAGAIEKAITGGAITWSPDLVAINARHQLCLQRARDGLDAARALLAAGHPPELVAEELRSALQAIGEVVGQVDAEELLGVIFGRFCIGK